MADNESLIVYGDPHLVPCAWVHRPDLKDDAFVALEEVARHCLTRRAHLVVPGDLYDSPHPPSVAVDAFKRVVERLKAAGLRVITTQGNHDLVAPGHPKWGVLCGAEDGDGLTFTVGGMTCFALDYRPASELQAVLANVPAVDVLFGHQLLDLYDARPGVWSMAADWVPAHVRTVVLNDVHEPWSTQDVRGIWIVDGSCSCLQTLPDTNACGSTDPRSGHKVSR